MAYHEFRIDTKGFKPLKPDLEAIIKIMVRSGYPGFDEMNPAQQAFAQAQCGLMLTALQKLDGR